MESSYNYMLVAVSLLLAVFASFVALSLASRITHVEERSVWYWGIGGAVSMGLGIWAMHFVGMLAFHLPIPVSYDIWLTVLSAAMAIAASATALFIVRNGIEKQWALTLATLFMAAGIAGMHYTGMAAMNMSPPIQYDPFLISVSIVIAIAAAYFALKLSFSAGEDGNFSIFSRSRGAAASFMGVAIAGMHYTGMAAAYFSPDSFCTTAGSGIETGLLSILIISGIIFIMLLTLILLTVDLKLADSEHQMLLSLQEKNEELRIRGEELRESREEAVFANKAKSDFLANMSHEMRTPMHAILSFSSIGKTRFDAASREKLISYFSYIHESGERLLALIDDLLDISKLESGCIEFNFHEFDLNSIVEMTLKHFGELLKSKALRLEMVPTNIDTTVWADQIKLIQVVSNLISNAIKFSPNGKSITISFEESELPIVKDDHEIGTIEAIKISVSDEGLGIPNDELESIFDKFIQSSRTHSGQGGTGLGLAICKEIIEGHNGTISALNNQKGGAVISFTLPRMIK